MPFQPDVSITWEEAVAVAREIILSHKDENIPGAVKRRKTVDQLSAEIDEALTFGDGPLADLFESLDGIAARIVIRFIVQSAYNLLKKKEKV